MVATPVIGLGTSAGPDDTLLNVTSRVVPLVSIPLVISAVLSQFSAAIADTAAAEENLRGLWHWMRGARPYLVSGAFAIALAATVPTFTIVAGRFARVRRLLRAPSRAGATQHDCPLPPDRLWDASTVMVSITLLAKPAG